MAAKAVAAEGRNCGSSFRDHPYRDPITFVRDHLNTTVDGRNPAPVDMVNIPLFTGFYTSQVVVWDFSHQQYGMEPRDRYWNL